MKKLIILLLILCGCEESYRVPEVEFNGLAEAELYGFLCDDSYSYTVIFMLKNQYTRGKCDEHFSKRFKAESGDTVWLGINYVQPSSANRSKTFRIYIDDNLVVISPHSIMYIVE